METTVCVPLSAHLARKGGMEVRMVSSVKRMRHLGYVLSPLLSPLLLEPRLVTGVQEHIQVASRHSAPVSNSDEEFLCGYLNDVRVARLWLIRKPSIRYNGNHGLVAILAARHQVLAKQVTISLDGVLVLGDLANDC